MRLDQGDSRPQWPQQRGRGKITKTKPNFSSKINLKKGFFLTTIISKLTTVNLVASEFFQSQLILIPALTRLQGLQGKMNKLSSLVAESYFVKRKEK